MQKVMTRAIGDRMTTALFFGATRKHHARQFPSVVAVDEYIDEVMDSEDAGELQIEMTACLLAAYMRVPKKTILVDYFGQEDPDAPDTTDGEVPDEDAEDPKDAPKKPARKPKAQ